MECHKCGAIIEVRTLRQDPTRVLLPHEVRFCPYCGSKGLEHRTAEEIANLRQGDVESRNTGYAGGE